MTTYLFFALLFLGLSAANYRFGRCNVLYPPFVLSLVWSGVLCLLMIPFMEMDQIGADTLSIVSLSLIAFSAGAMLTRPRLFQTAVFSEQTNASARKILLGFCLAIFPAYYHELGRLSGLGGVDGFLASARLAIIEALSNGETPFANPIYNIVPVLAVFVAFVFMIELRDWKKERWWLLGSLTLALVYSILTTGRTLLLELLLGLAGVYLLKSHRTSLTAAWKIIRWPSLGFVLLFSLLVPITKQTGSENGSVAQGVVTYGLGYAIIPLGGFNYVVHHPSEYRYEPNHTFREIIPVLRKVSGMNFIPPRESDDFVETPFPTNTYTAFKFYYVDFGLTGLLVCMFLIGAGQTWLFRRAMTGDHLYIFLFAMSLFPLVISSFDDQYSLFVKYSKDLLFAVLYFRVLKTISIPLGQSTVGQQETT